MNHAVWKQVAAKLRDLWIAERRAKETALLGVPSRYTPPPSLWTGRPPGKPPAGTKAASRKPPFWFRLAEYVHQRKFDPTYFIKAQFAGDRFYQNPEILLGPKADQNYRDFIEQIERDVQLAYTSQHNTATSEYAVRLGMHADDVETWLDVIQDDALPLTALYRTCAIYRLRLIPKLGTSQLRQLAVALYAYEPAAVRDYICLCKLYDRVWEDFIPDAFRERANELYSAL